MQSLRINKTSKYRGVHLNNGRWRAIISLNGKQRSLGYYDSEDKAAVAYNNAARKYHKEKAKLNLIT